MRRVLILLLIALPTMAQTPTFVQGASCPASGAAGSGNGTTSTTPDYICPFPEATLAGNLNVLGLMYDNSGTPTITVTSINSAGTTVDTLTQIVTNTTANANVQRIYAKTNGTGGAVAIKVHSTQQSGFVMMTIGEFFNVSTTGSGTAVCNRVSSTTVTSGNITVANGGLLVNTMNNDDGTASGSLTVGSGFTFAATDRHDGIAMQYRLGTGSAINSTITQGVSHAAGSCSAGWTSATAGTAPSTTNRLLHQAHAQMPTASANPFIIQTPVAGNLIVIHQHGGVDTISSITDTASNTYTCKTAHTSGTNVNQICYSLTGNASNTDAISITRSGTTGEMTLMTYDVTAAGFLFDTETGGGSSSGAKPSTLTVCSSCFTPGAQNELIFASSGWDFCTGTDVTAPSGAPFLSAHYNGNGVDGPQTVDQNNGWLMHRNGSSVTPISITWTVNCVGTTGASLGAYAYSVASFKPAPSGPPPNQFPRIQ